MKTLLKIITLTVHFLLTIYNQLYLNKKISNENELDFYKEIITLIVEELVKQNLEIKEDLNLYCKYINDNIDTLILDVSKILNQSFDFDKNNVWRDLTFSFKNPSYFDYVVETISDILKPKLDYFYRYRSFKKFLKDLKDDKSHITFKLKQSLSYFKKGLFENLTFIQNDSNNSLLNLVIPKDYFINNIGINDIPIAFFKYDIEVLKTTESDESIRELLVVEEKLKPYSFNQLSSGEQQSIHTILNIVYHTYNLLSVKKTNDNNKYNKVSIIFDELELYMHPEYQRKFLNNVLTVLKIFENEDFEYYNKDLKFSILLSTHSPFVLSDIPSQNILKLSNGIPKAHDKINSFGSNIHDLLADEFFLKDGFMGEFASNKINNIYNKISELDVNNRSINLEEFDDLTNEINLIGERVLREPLLNLLDKIMKNSPENKEILIRKYKALIEELDS